MPEAISAFTSDANKSQSPWRVQNKGQMPKRSRARITRRCFWSHRAMANWPRSVSSIASPWSSHRCGNNSVSQWVRKWWPRASRSFFTSG